LRAREPRKDGKIESPLKKPSTAIVKDLVSSILRMLNAPQKTSEIELSNLGNLLNYSANHRTFIPNNRTTFSPANVRQMPAKSHRRELDANSSKRTIVVTKETVQYRLDLLEALRNGSKTFLSSPLPSLNSLEELELWRSGLKQRRLASTRAHRLPTHRLSSIPSQIIPNRPEIPHDEEEESLSVQSQNIEIPEDSPELPPPDQSLSIQSRDIEIPEESPEVPPPDESLSIQSQNIEIPEDSPEVPPVDESLSIQSQNIEITEESLEVPPVDESLSIQSRGIEITEESPEVPHSEEESLSIQSRGIKIADEVPPNDSPLSPSTLTLAVNVSSALHETSSDSVETLPIEWYSAIRARGFGSLFFIDFPNGGNLDLVRSTASSANLKVLTIPTIDENSNSPILLPPDPETGIQYSYDPTLLQKLRVGDWDAFVAAIESKSVSRSNFVYFTTHPFELSAGLLLLPGLRVFQGEDCFQTSALLRILLRKALHSGVFSIPEIHRTFGKMVVWKYNTNEERILVCFNFVNSHAVTDIVCPDVGDAIDDDKIEVFELLSETTFRREPNQMRTTGLHVILHEYQVQVFSY
jgi:hypothetical protein